MDYKENSYSRYISTHTSHLYGVNSINKIEKNFIIWDKWFLDFIPRDKSSKIIDLGCGDGSFVHYLQRKGYTNVTGVDVSSEQVQFAQTLGITGIVNSDIKVYLANNTGFDLIIARDLIEHFNINDLLSIIELTYSVLNTDGILLVQTSNGESPFFGRYRYGDISHETSFTTTSLSQIFALAGFKQMAFYPMAPTIRGLKSGVRYFLWKGIENVIKLYLLIEGGTADGIFTQNLIAVATKQ